MVKKEKLLVPISERALVARIQRKLKPDGQRLIKHRVGTPAYNGLGQYCIVNQFDADPATHQDLEKLAKALGCLKPYEKLED